jgi:hypothetical protein
VKIGISSALLSLELVIVSIFHLYIYSWKPYQIRYDTVDTDDDNSKPDAPLTHSQGGLLGYGALLAAVNPWDVIKSFARAVRWVIRGRRNRSSTGTMKDVIPLQAEGETDEDHQHEHFVWT